MIPLKDNIPSRRFPFVNIILIAVNFLVFFYELSLGDHLEAFIYSFSVIPEHLHKNPYALTNIGTLFSAQFLHGGWMHVIGNMLFLYIFGDNVEDRLGHTRYLLFYLACGVISFLAQVFFSQNSPLPLIGASGAIAGVLGAYIVLYPYAKILTLIPLFIFIQFIEVPAIVFLGIWFLLQFWMANASLAAATVGGVAFWAHVGGFIGGALFISIYKSIKGR